MIKICFQVFTWNPENWNPIANNAKTCPETTPQLTATVPALKGGVFWMAPVCSTWIWVNRQLGSTWSIQYFTKKDLAEIKQVVLCVLFVSSDTVFYLLDANHPLQSLVGHPNSTLKTAIATKWNFEAFPAETSRRYQLGFGICCDACSALLIVDTSSGHSPNGHSVSCEFRPALKYFEIISANHHHSKGVHVFKSAQAWQVTRWWPRWVSLRIHQTVRVLCGQQVPHQVMKVYDRTGIRWVQKGMKCNMSKLFTGVVNGWQSKYQWKWEPPPLLHSVRIPHQIYWLVISILKRRKGLWTLAAVCVKKHYHHILSKKFCLYIPPKVNTVVGDNHNAFILSVFGLRLKNYWCIRSLLVMSAFHDRYPTKPEVMIILDSFNAEHQALGDISPQTCAHISLSSPGVGNQSHCGACASVQWAVSMQEPTRAHKIV